MASGWLTARKHFVERIKYLKDLPQGTGKLNCRCQGLLHNDEDTEIDKYSSRTATAELYTLYHRKLIAMITMACVVCTVASETNRPPEIMFLHSL